MTKIEVISGSRLHFGLICGTPQTGWVFGGIGMMLRQPAWRLSMQSVAGGADQVAAGDETTNRVIEFLGQIRTSLPLGAVDVAVTEEIPFHTGLGGGTQLALALAAAAELLTGQKPSHDPYRLAQLAQRAERSAVGTVGFRDGGFLIDHGVPDHPQSIRQVERIPIPEDWRFILVRPKASQGMCGDRERSFFSRQVQMPEPLVRRLAEQIQQFLEPAIKSRQFDLFAETLETYGREVGSFYAAEQGDVFAHPAIRRLVKQLRSEGVTGAAQSSWGPGISIPARSMVHARSIAELIPTTLDQSSLALTIAEPLNTGATVRSSSDESGRRQWA